MACSDNRNPLQRGGTSQQERQLAALKSSYARVDEKDFADWIVFADSFSEYLVYFDNTNSANGNWKPFFDSDITAVLGSIAIQDVDAYRRLIKDTFKILQSDDNQGNIPLLKETLGALFAYVFTLAKALDSYANQLPEGNGLRLSIYTNIQSKLLPAGQRLIAYYKAAKKLGLIVEKDYLDIKVLNQPVKKAGTVLTEGFSYLWLGSKSSWSAFYTGISADDSVFGDEAWDDYRRINHIANHNLFSGTFDTFLLVYARSIVDAETQLLARLTDFNDHPPHYALFLAFLKLFRIVQDDINTITQRHLDFYYKEVLQLLPKSPEPNHAHVIFELAKQVDDYLLTKGTLLKAGKDSLGKDLVYALDRDVVFNKASVAKLMSVYKGTAAENITDANDAILTNNDGRLFASPITNSADGLGAEIKNVNGEWHPFVNKSFTDGELTSVNMPKALVGFAVATSNLYLAEGERRIYVKMVNSGAIPFSNGLQCDAYLTTEKGWFKLEQPSFFHDKTSGAPLVESSILGFLLSGDAPAITNYNAKVHGGTFNCSTPILKVYLNHKDYAQYTYDSMRYVTITRVEVEVRVGLDDSDAVIEGGLKKLSLMNDLGVLDPSKPFLAFGPAPRIGASLIIGNDEVFRKKGATVALNMEWVERPTTTGDIAYSDTVPKGDLNYLAKGLWKPVGTGYDLFGSNTPKIPASGVTATNSEAKYEDDYKPYDVLSRSGFLKLTVNADFGYDDYQKGLTDHLIILATGKSDTFSKKAPYVPKMKSISLHYKALVTSDLSNKDVNDFNNRSLQYFHLYPFGEAEQRACLNGGEEVYVFPQFDHGISQPHNAEFYIGIEHLKPRQSVNVLFQVLEGSTDPLLDKPDDHITWSYLSNNKWLLFNKQDVTDNTSMLIQSGIISFVIPDNATIAHTVLPTGYIWLRASVNEKAEAVCKLLRVAAQAAVVNFQDQENASDFLEHALPAATIAKLKEPLSSVRKIEQPFASFGGKPLETNEHFYLRVSERLRHKSRAINIWDYEHLILEAFPEIHRVKCLNHTKYINDDYNEISPGYVTIITIPSLVNNNETNPLRPYTKEDTLQQIESFLKKKISAHVQLNVRQPQFEEVMLDFKLKLVNGLEYNYYSQQLQSDITAFLTPWAYGITSDVQFGGKISKSVLINFIEERSYVDYITEVKMYWRETEADVFSEDMDEVNASSARSILVSVPASRHKIEEIQEVGEGERNDACVDTWNVQINDVS